MTPESVKLQNNFQVQLLEKLSPLGLVTVHKQEQFYHFTLSVTSSFNVLIIFFFLTSHPVLLLENFCFNCQNLSGIKMFLWEGESTHVLITK